MILLVQTLQCFAQLIELFKVLEGLDNSKLYPVCTAPKLLNSLKFDESFRSSPQTPFLAQVITAQPSMPNDISFSFHSLSSIHVLFDMAKLMASRTSTLLPEFGS